MFCIECLHNLQRWINATLAHPVVIWLVLAFNFGMIEFFERIGVIVNKHKGFLVGIVEIAARVLNVAHHVHESCGAVGTSLHQLMSVRLCQGYSLVGSFSRTAPFLLVVFGKHALTVLVGELGEHLVAIEQWRGGIEQQHSLQGCRSFLAIETEKVATQTALGRKHGNGAVEQLNRGIDTVVDRRARNLHLADFGIGWNVFRYKHYRAVAADKLEIHVCLARLDLCLPHRAFLFLDVVRFVDVLKEDVAITDSSIEFVSAPDVAVGILCLLLAFGYHDARNSFLCCTYSFYVGVVICNYLV